jgi:hypothetical protein
LNGAEVWQGTANEDGSFSLLARVCALEGSGSEYAPGEGPVLQQADISTVTAKVEGPRRPVRGARPA